MESTKLIYENGIYLCRKSSSVRMDILGTFLSSDVGCNGWFIFKEWATADKTSSRHLFSFSSNATFLRKKEEYIFLEDITSEEESSDFIKMTRQQFVQLLDDWQEKVCIPRPKEVIIKYENDQYSIETNN